MKLNGADFPKELVELVEEAMKSNITKEDFKIFLNRATEKLNTDKFLLTYQIFFGK